MSTPDEKYRKDPLQQKDVGLKGMGRREFLGKSAGAVVLGAAVVGSAGQVLAQNVTTPKLGTPDWSTLQPGVQDSDLFVETNGYDEKDELSWWPGRNVGGVTIGLIQFRANLPMMPGNMGNATTFDFPMLYRELQSDNIYDIMADQPTKAFTDATVRAANWLELQGVRAIIGACGFFGSYQKSVQARINTPFFSSSLMQLPMIVQSMPGDKKVGVLTANGPVLTKCPAIENCGLSHKDQNERVLIEGLQDGEEFQNVMQLTGKLHPAKLEKEIVAGAKRLMKKDKEIGAILLECTELSPHAFAVQDAVRVPVWDYTTMTNWIYSGCVRRPFTGHI